ncbi:MAG: transcription antitermination factor NusB [Candidatus Omnitrophota bacterium]
MRKRTKARELALQVLFQIDITGENAERVLELFWQNQAKPLEPDIKDFAEILIQGVRGTLSNLDEIIAKYATNWLIKRMAVIDRNVLRLATFEILNLPDVPIRVSINEAVDLAKKFGDLDSGKFVNGILDKISKSEKFIKNN